MHVFINFYARGQYCILGILHKTESVILIDEIFN
jgi:hypothetical protein